MAQKLLVTGASGKLGQLVLDALLRRGVAASDIVATTRDPSKLAGYAAKGIEVRAADFNDTELTRKAFTGADRIALISTDALVQAKLKPIYETLDGWNETTAGAKSWAQLPANAIKYVKRVAFTAAPASGESLFRM